MVSVPLHFKITQALTIYPLSFTASGRDQPADHLGGPFRQFRIIHLGRRCLCSSSNGIPTPVGQNRRYLGAQGTIFVYLSRATDLLTGSRAPDHRSNPCRPLLQPVLYFSLILFLTGSVLCGVAQVSRSSSFISLFKTVLLMASHFLPAVHDMVGHRSGCLRCRRRRPRIHGVAHRVRNRPPRGERQVGQYA